MKTTVPFRHRVSVGRHILAGILGPDWRALRKANAIDGEFRGRALILSMLSRFNSLAAKRELARYGSAIEATEVTHPPIVLVGYWRSGTTHLHQLLALDRRFGFVPTLDAIHPHTSLVTGTLFGGRRPKVRPMDGVLQGSGTPQEDEFAIAVRSLCSPFLGFVFPRAAAHYDRYLTLDEATTEERTRWTRAFTWTLKKATRAAGGRPVVLKSPPHTAKIHWIRNLFPNAKFIHIHRDPVDVIASQLALNDTLGWHSYLQMPDRASLAEDALRRYRLMFEAFFRDVPDIPAGNFTETSYRALTADPVGTIEKIYRALNLPDFEGMRGGLTQHVANQPAYRRVARDPMPADLVARVSETARGSMERWGYSSRPQSG